MEQQFPEKDLSEFSNPNACEPRAASEANLLHRVRTESKRPLLHVPVSIAFSRGMKDAVFRSVANLPTVAAAVQVAPVLLQAGAVFEAAGLFTS